MLSREEQKLLDERLEEKAYELNSDQLMIRVLRMQGTTYEDIENYKGDVLDRVVKSML